MLIQVPEVKRGIRSARRPSPAAVQRVRRHAPSRGRRRLRREVRVVATALAAIVPLLMAAALLRHATPHGGRPAEASRDARTSVLGGIRPPSVSLSIEAPGFAPRPEPQAPVILPGYLLPDDGEDPAHAGG
ncbi:MAG: hypothetical protein U0835_23265 [Isosphaeraceae bacterium]